MADAKEKRPLFSSTELRMIGFSLAILSLGLAIAWLGFALFFAR